MTNIKMNASGSNVFWTLSVTNKQVLHAQLEPLGLEDMITERVGIRVMRRAIDETMPEAALVRRTQLGTELEVVNETLGEGANQYDHRLTVDLNKPEAWTDEMSRAFDRQKQLLDPYQVGRILREMVFKLGGIKIRETGGIYWIPGDRVAEFRQLSDAVEASGAGNKVYFQTISLDAPTIETLRDSLSREVEAEAASIIDDLSNEIGQRGIDNRRATAKELLEKVRAYEGLLTTSLDGLRKSIEEIEVAAAAAELIAAGRKEAKNGSN